MARPSITLSSIVAFDTEKGDVKLHYYAETDSLYIELAAGVSSETREIVNGLNVDFDAAGGVVGFDIDNAARQFDLTSIDTGTLPLRARLAE